MRRPRVHISNTPRRALLCAALLALSVTPIASGSSRPVGSKWQQERAEQRDRLRGLGCAFGQGFFFSHPLAADAVEGTLHRQDVASGHGALLQLRPAAGQRSAS